MRADTYGYLQRSFLGCVSATDQKEAREVGQKAVQFAVLHGKDGSVTIHRVGDYAVDYRLSALTDIAALTKHMPDEFINKEGNGVTKAFIDYCRPLIGGDLPTVARFRAPAVEKVLGK